MKDQVLSGRPLSLAVLALSLFRVILARAFGVTTGLTLFRENYDEDRLPPVEPEERERMTRFSRCIACGRCDVGEGARITASRGAYPGLMTVVLSSTRSMPDYDAALLALDHVPDEVLREKAALCPTGVPFEQLAQFVRAKAELTAGRRLPPHRRPKLGTGRLHQDA